MPNDRVIRSIRNIPNYEWQQANDAAERRRIFVGEWITEAIRAKIAAEREPMSGASVESAPHWSGAALSITDLDAWARVAQFRAAMRTGRYAGRVTQAEQKAFRRIYDQTVKSLAYDDPSYTPPAAARRAIADDLHIEAGDTDVAHAERLGGGERQV